MFLYSRPVEELPVRTEARAHIPQGFDGVVSFLRSLKVKIISLKALHLGQKILTWLIDFCHNSKEKRGGGGRTDIPQAALDRNRRK